MLELATAGPFNRGGPGIWGLLAGERAMGFVWDLVPGIWDLPAGDAGLGFWGLLARERALGFGRFGCPGCRRMALRPASDEGMIRFD